MKNKYFKNDVRNVLAMSPKKLFGAILATSLVLGGILVQSPIEASASSQTKIFAGSGSSFAITPDGNAWSWGNGNQAGLATRTSSSGKALLIPTVNKYRNIVEIETGLDTDSFSMAVASDGTVWGVGSHGFIPELKTTKYDPVQIAGLSNIKDIAVSQEHILAVDGNGDVWAWGSNRYSDFGDGTAVTPSAPVKIGTVPKAKSVEIAINGSSLTSYVLDTSGNVWAWGVNVNGQLGDGTTTYNKIPTKVKNISNITEISAGAGHVLALKSDGTVWGWGRNNYAQAGTGNNFAVPGNLPVQVPITNVVSVSAGSEHSIVRKSDGTVWGWGRNDTGQLGNGTTSPQYVTAPTQATNITGVIDVKTAVDHTLALKQDGTVWAWGGNGSGKLGINNANGITKTEAVQVQFPVIDNVAPTITLTPSITSPTNQDVTVTATITDDNAGSLVTKVATGDQPASYFASGGGSNLTGNTFTVFTNDTYTVYAKDQAGNASVKTIVISNIDKKAPVLTLTPSTTNPTKDDVIVSVSASDTGSGVAKLKWAKGALSAGLMATAGVDLVNNSFAVSSNDMYTVYAKDQAGNETVQYIDVRNIDKIAPGVATFSADKTTITNTDVVVTITYPSDASVKEYKIGTDGTWMSYATPIVMSKNDTIFARSKDEVGNVSAESSYVVSNIDKEPPMAPTVFLLTTEPTNKTVIALPIFYEDPKIRQYRLNENDPWIDSPNGTQIQMTKNGTIYLRSVDDAGNEVQSSFEVTNIDKIIPTSPTLSVTDKTLTVQPGTDAESGVKETRVKIDGGQWVVYSSPITLSVGVHDIEAKTVDRAGNESPVVTKHVIVMDQEALDHATEEVEKAEQDKTQEQVDKAKDLVDALPASPEKDDLLDRLKDVQDQIDADKALETATNEVIKAEQDKTQEQVDKAKDAVDALPASPEKDDLLDRLKDVQDQIDADKALENATNEVIKAEKDKTQEQVDKAKDLVDALPASPEKDDLLDRLKDVQDQIDADKALENATNEVIKAEQEKTQEQVDKAKDAVDALPASPEKDDLLDRLKDVQDQIDADKALENATNEVIKAEQEKTQEQVDKAKDAVDALPASPEKDDLLDRLKEVQDQIDADHALKDATEKVVIAEQSKKQDDIDHARDAVNALPDSSDKQKLQDRLDAIVPDTGGTTPPTGEDDIIPNKDLPSEIGKLTDPADKATFSDILKAIERAEANPTNRVLVQLAWDKVKAVPDSVKNKMENKKIYNSLYQRAEKLKNDFNAGLEQESLQVAIKKATDYVVSYEKYKIAYYKTKAQEAVNALPAGETKTALQARIDAVVMK